jgi:uncharacterized protein involved in outer membrane biogenesis
MDAAAPALAPRSRLRRASLRALLVVAALLVLWAAAALYVPPIVAAQIENAGAQHLGRRVAAGQVEFNPWTLELTLADVAVEGAAPGAAPLLAVRRIRADVSAWSLLRLAPVIDALEIDAPMLHVRRTGEGRHDVDDVVERIAAAMADPDDEPARFALHNIVLREGGADYVDEPLQATHRLRGVELGVPFISSLPSEREVTVEPRLAFTLDGSRFDSAAAATPFAERGNGEARLRIDGFDVRPFLGYLPRGLPVQLRAATLAADLRIAFEQRPTLSLNVSGSVGASGIEVVDARAQELLRVGSIDVAIESLRPLERRVSLRRIALDAPHLMATRDAAGKVNLMLAAEAPSSAGAKLVRVPLPTSSAAASAAAASAASASAAAASAARSAAAQPAAGAWSATLASLAVRAGRLEWRDASTAPAATLGVDGFMLEAQSIAWPFAAPVAFKGEGSLGAGKERGKLVFSGKGHTSGAEVELSLAGLPLPPFQPYLASIVAAPVAGALSADMKVAWRPGAGVPNLQLDARRLHLARFAFGDAKAPELAADEIELNDARVDSVARTAAIGRVALRAPRLRAERDAAQRWGFERWLASAPKRTVPVGSAASAPVVALAASSPVPVPAAAGAASRPAAAASAAPTGTDMPWKLAVAEFAIDGGQLAFNDRALAVPASLDVRDLAVQLRGWTLDGGAAAPFRVAAR